MTYIRLIVIWGLLLGPLLHEDALGATGEGGRHPTPGLKCRRPISHLNAKDLSILSLSALPPIQKRPGQGDPDKVEANSPPSACDAALNSCIEVVNAQDSLIAQLRDTNHSLTNALADANKPPILPTWAVVVLSVVVGVAITSAVRR